MTLTQQSQRIDRFTQTLPAFKALGMLKGAVSVVDSAMDEASAALCAEKFGCWMDVAEHAVEAAQAALDGFRAEVVRGKGLSREAAVVLDAQILVEAGA